MASQGFFFETRDESRGRVLCRGKGLRRRLTTFDNKNIFETSIGGNIMVSKVMEKTPHRASETSIPMRW